MRRGVRRWWSEKREMIEATTEKRVSDNKEGKEEEGDARGDDKVRGRRAGEKKFMLQV